jgi:inner membrane protein
MPTIFTHPAVPLAVGVALGPKVAKPPLVLAGIIASILPDLDVFAFRLGIPYSAEFGHRGFSHSLFVAAVVALIGAFALYPLRVPPRTSIWFLFLSMASHGIPDTFTTGGSGIALLWPFSVHRYFAPFQVILVSPLSFSRFLSDRGLAVLGSELRWVWLPCAASALLLYAIRKLFLSRQPSAREQEHSGAVN